MNLNIRNIKKEVVSLLIRKLDALPSAPFHQRDAMKSHIYFLFPAQCDCGKICRHMCFMIY